MQLYLLTLLALLPATFIPVIADDDHKGCSDSDSDSDESYGGGRRRIVHIHYAPRYRGHQRVPIIIHRTKHVHVPIPHRIVEAPYIKKIIKPVVITHQKVIQEYPKHVPVYVDRTKHVHVPVYNRVVEAPYIQKVLKPVYIDHPKYVNVPEEQEYGHGYGYGGNAGYGESSGGSSGGAVSY